VVPEKTDHHDGVYSLDHVSPAITNRFVDLFLDWIRLGKNNNKRRKTNLQQDLKINCVMKSYIVFPVLLIYLHCHHLMPVTSNAYNDIKDFFTTRRKKEGHFGSIMNCAARPLKGVCLRTIWYAWECIYEKSLFDELLEDWNEDSFWIAGAL